MKIVYRLEYNKQSSPRKILIMPFLQSDLGQPV